MKKGFTLVELLGVITLLGIIGLIAIPSVNGLISSSKEKAYNTQVKEIKEAAKSYFSDNLDSDEVCVNLSKLISEGYIETEDGNLKDPRNSSVYMDGSVEIIHQSGTEKYDFEYNETFCQN